MSAISLCTFNANNLYARYRFGETFPGDRSRKSATEAGWGYLPMNTEGTTEIFNETQRELASRILADGKAKPGKADYPDILCLQEVESLLALRKFNEQHLRNAYDHAVLIDGRDLRQIDVAVLSKREILSVRSHMDDPHPAPTKKCPFVFSRDCLEVVIALNGSTTLTLFVNHLKSKYAETKAEKTAGDKLRMLQAERVVEIVQERFPGQTFQSELFAVLGDLNDEANSPALAALYAGSGLQDAFGSIGKVEDRWTHWYRSENTVSQLDHLLVSPALSSALGGPPRIERRGIGFARVLQDGSPGPRVTRFQQLDDDPNPIEISFQFQRLSGVTPQDYASDHCPVFVEFDI